MSVYFVLNGLVNGEDGEYAIEAGGDDARRVPDGWYFLKDGDADGTGPYDHKQEAEHAAELHKLHPDHLSWAFKAGYKSAVEEMAGGGCGAIAAMERRCVDWLDKVLMDTR